MSHCFSFLFISALTTFLALAKLATMLPRFDRYTTIYQSMAFIKKTITVLVDSVNVTALHSQKSKLIRYKEAPC